MEEDKKFDYTRVALINEGRAVELGDTHLREINYGADFTVEILDDEEYIQVDSDSMLYISANGDVKTDCDLAYNNCTLNIGNLFEESLVFMILSRAKGNFDISL